MEVICSICGSEGGPRSYISNLDLEENSSILKWFLHLEDAADVYKLKTICAICMQKIKIISFSLSDLRKKYIETQILLEHYMKNIITDSWTDFKQSESAVNIIDQNQCDIENWKYSIEQFTHKHYKECFPSEDILDSSDPKLCDVDKKQLLNDDGCTNLEWIVNALNENHEENLENNPIDATIQENLENNSTNIIVDETSNTKENVTKMTYNHLIKRKDDEFICCLCKSSFKWRYLVEYHIRSKHTQERPFTCKICSKGFTAANRLKRHISAMHESGRFVCQTCGQAFSRRYVLLSHEKTHNESPNIPCSHENCEKKFYSKDSLNAHIANSHKVNSFICDRCGNKFRTSARLMNHRKRHEEKTLKCPSCPMMFSVKADLLVHVKYHRNAWPWRCGACNMFFKTARGLQNHFAISHGDKINKVEMLSNLVNKT